MATGVSKFGMASGGLKAGPADNAFSSHPLFLEILITLAAEDVKQIEDSRNAKIGTKFQIKNGAKIQNTTF